MNTREDGELFNQTFSAFLSKLALNMLLWPWIFAGSSGRKVADTFLSRLKRNLVLLQFPI